MNGTRILVMTLVACATLGCGGALLAPPPRPNVLLIVADDLGYSDVGALGGEIPTPAIDSLAAGGMLFTNFHVAATCSPTRAMLMSGADSHRAGLGNMGEFLTEEQRGRPGYEGHLNHRVTSLATHLREAGYATLMAGKWHLGGEPRQLPSARGFDRSFALVEGAASAWDDRSAAPSQGDRVHFVRDGSPASRPTGRFAATLYVDELIGFLDEVRAAEAPFFAYLAFQSVHWPHHTPERFLATARGRYDAGWRAVRAARLARQRELGLFPPDVEPSPLEPTIPPWQSLDAEQRRDEAARMEAYAAMTMAMDFEVGRLVEYLRQSGRLDDTLLLFVSDNGPDPSEPERSALARGWYGRQYPDTAPADYGGPNSFPSTGFAWARVSATPLRAHKGQPFEGGLRVPFIAHHPRSIRAGTRSDAFGFATDLVPTVLHAARLATPAQGGMQRTGLDLDGTSLWGVMRRVYERARDEDAAVGYELMGNSALYRGSLKLVRSHGQPWQLFDLARDPGETRDLAGERAEEFDSLLRAYDGYAREMGVIPVPPDFDVMQQLLRSSRGGDATPPGDTRQ